MTEAIGKKSASMQLYHDRLKPVLMHVQNNLTRPLRLDEAAALSHFSKYHFHRIFLAVVGETLNAYTNRVRLERAAGMMLFCPELSTTDIAFQCGFQGSATFARAFKKHFDVSPTMVRNTQSKRNKLSLGKKLKQLDLDRLQRFHQTQAELQSNATATLQPTGYKEKDRQHSVSLRSKNGYELHSIYECWNCLFDWAKAQGISEEAQIRFALCHDNPIFTPAHQCRYDASLVIPESLVDQVKPPMQSTELPAGKYAIFHYSGPLEKCAEFHMRIYGEWLPRSGYEPDVLPTIERYTQPLVELDTHSIDPSNTVTMEIWFKVLPLRKLYSFTDPVR